MEINIAFALSQNGAFEKKHFGDADKYQIYHLNNDVFQLLHDEVNPYKSLDETAVHGAKKKADQIIKLLKEKKVSVLVSRQFGKRIQFIANHFIPVKVKDDTPAKVEVTLLKHMRWLQDELINHSEGYKMFVMDSGIIKQAVKKPNA